LEYTANEEKKRRRRKERLELAGMDRLTEATEVACANMKIKNHCG